MWRRRRRGSPLAQEMPWRWPCATGRSREQRGLEACRCINTGCALCPAIVRGVRRVWKTLARICNPCGSQVVRLEMALLICSWCRASVAGLGLLRPLRALLHLFLTTAALLCLAACAHCSSNFRACPFACATHAYVWARAHVAQHGLDHCARIP